MWPATIEVMDIERNLPITLLTIAMADSLEGQYMRLAWTR